MENNYLSVQSCYEVLRDLNESRHGDDQTLIGLVNNWYVRAGEYQRVDEEKGHYFELRSYFVNALSDVKDFYEVKDGG